MKTLYIMTHPLKEEHSNEDDFFVPLSPKGIEDTKKLAQKLKDKNISPDIIVSSPSLRTETTSMIIFNELNIKKKILYNEVLYQGFLDELIEEIHFTFYSVKSMFIVGHAPLLSNLANHFIGYKDKMKSGLIFKITFDTSSWVDVNPQNATLTDTIEL